MDFFCIGKKILLDSREGVIILQMRQRLDRIFLLPKIDKTAQLAIPATCWSLSQTINFRKIAGWAF